MVLRRIGRAAFLAGGSAPPPPPPPDPPTFVGMGALMNASGSTSLAFDLPAFEDGDFGFMVALAHQSLNNTPFGWDQRAIFVDPSAKNTMKVWTRHLQTGDTDPTVTSNSTLGIWGRIYVFRDVASPLVIEDSGSKDLISTNGGNDVAPTNGCKLPTADPTSANGLVFCCYGFHELSTSRTINAGLDGAGFTELHRDAVTNGGIAAGYRVVDAAGSYAPFNWGVTNVGPFPLRGSFMLCADPA